MRAATRPGRAACAPVSAIGLYIAPCVRRRQQAPHEEGLEPRARSRAARDAAMISASVDDMAMHSWPLASHANTASATSEKRWTYQPPNPSQPCRGRSRPHQWCNECQGTWSCEGSAAHGVQQPVHPGWGSPGNATSSKWPRTHPGGYEQSVSYGLMLLWFAVRGSSPPTPSTYFTVVSYSIMASPSSCTLLPWCGEHTTELKKYTGIYCCTVCDSFLLNCLLLYCLRQACPSHRMRVTFV